ncbi:DUF4192 domain-containing protein [Actinoplanes sp. LDG1-06]|uniref:DUF4192 domain-containing protein n=1 Tax=Paractinoplanes ovalisporus TaxID=2810368 RepID=A0ABS2AU70_9ACTN|nr:DUF4192 domain-containing protein [Actinoplanes ovalisporus]MBM2623415.1 DUF4192 domain-containing protein [Actinoplanes ovalisporus]
MFDPSPSLVRGPADLLTTIPYLLGFHPRECVVVVVVTADRSLASGVTIDWSAPDSFIVGKSTLAAIRDKAREVYVVGYGALSYRERLARIADGINISVAVQACLLVEHQRFYCLDGLCTCTPEHGAVLDPSRSVIAAEMTLRGRVVLPSREHFVMFLKPDSDAQARTISALTKLPATLPDPRTVVHASLDIAAAGGNLSDEQVALLATALLANAGRSTAWQASTDEPWQQDLWLNMVRRVPENFVATPANLVAWVSWRRGQPALASAALSKAVEAMPDNTLSHLIGKVLATGLDPQTLPWPLPNSTDPH